MPSMNQRYYRSTEGMDAVEGAECTCLIQLLSPVYEQVRVQDMGQPILPNYLKQNNFILKMTK